MTQALYAHMNNKIKKKRVVGVTQCGELKPQCHRKKFGH
jgi:hypothetical protein